VRYPPDQKAKAKQAILDAGANALRKKGFHGIGVDGLAAAAGVTSGAFYSNFSGKEELLKDVIETCLGNPFIDADAGSLAERRARLKDYLRMYISRQHRDDPAAGCVVPTLSADVSRSSASVRKAYQRSMKEFIRKLSKVLAGAPADREKKAWTIMAMMVGAVLVAQALPPGKEAEKIIEAALERAIAISDEE
jgi:TetR/AcrR family transcriptional regulator, transcriptional repressor for nem operon